jgi:hypothetical protein
MPELRVYRSPWRDFPDVVVQTTIAKLKAHPDYPNAKAGDPESGIRVVSDLLKPGKVTFKIDAIVPVLQLDANKRNSIPISYAALLATELKVPVSANVLQINQVSHTGADAASRILGQPIFDGKIEAGTRVIEGLFGYTVQIGSLLHDHATLMAAGGQCGQTAMQIDQGLRNELLFRHVHSKFCRRLFLPFSAS